MRTKIQIVQEEFGVQTPREAIQMFNKDLYHHAGRNFAQTKLQLPYEAPEHPELPSVEEIDRVMREDPYSRKHPCVCRIGPLMIKKHQAQHLLQEAEDLIYLKAHSQVRVPKVYSVFTAIDAQYGPVNYMISEFIEGETLSSEKWMTFSHDTRNRILSRLCEQFRLLRATPSPGYYGRVHRQGFFRRAALLRGRGIKDSGPYDTYEDFLTALYRTNEIGCAVNTGWDVDVGLEVTDALSKFHSELGTCTGTQPVFTHVDPALHNIIARSYYNEKENTEDWEVTLIDFQFCGWLPAWMQAAVFRERINMYTRSTDKNNTEEGEHVIKTILQSLEADYTPQMEYMSELESTCGTSVI